MDKYGLSESTTYQVFREAGHPISGGLVRFGPEPPMNIPKLLHSGIRHLMSSRPRE